MKVLFICSGNICRSPMAAAYLRHVVSGSPGRRAVEVESSGTLGIEGAPASDEAIVAMEEIGVDLEPVDVCEGDVVRIPVDAVQRISNTGENDLVFYAVCSPPFKTGCYVSLE